MNDINTIRGIFSGGLPEEMWKAVDALAEKPALARALVDDLLALLVLARSGQDAPIRAASARVLAGLAGDDSVLRDKLYTGLRQKDSPLRRAETAHTIGLMAGNGPDFGPELLAQLRLESDSTARCRIVEALGRINFVPAREAIAKFRNDPDEALRRAVSDALKKLS